nr:24 kda antigenic surface protein {N-terminal} [Haemophilus ducreyi, CCUG 7470, Peptide Partial, 25 aa] [[Haemophilus] ducreyi]
MRSKTITFPVLKLTGQQQALTNDMH